MPFRSVASCVLVLGLVQLCASAACSNAAGSSSGAGGRGGSGGVVATGGAIEAGAGAGASSETTPGSGGAVATGGSSDSGGASAGASTESGGTADGGSQYPNVGVCGRRAKATADATSFDGYEERYVIGEEGFGTAICVVRFDLERVGDAPSGCTVCSWTHLLEYGNPSVVTDTDGVCAQSDLGLNEAGIAKIAGSRVTLGFAKQLGGAHGSARMTYVETTGEWDVVGNATWNETSKAFSSDYREGLCNYGP